MRLCVLALPLAAISLSAAGVREYHYTRAEWKNVRNNTIIEPEKPEYPFEARRNHLAGEGCFRLHIAPSGIVTSVTILKGTGHQLLDAAAIKAFSKWRTKPGLRRELDVPISFRLSSGSHPPPPPAHYPCEPVLREFTP